MSMETGEPAGPSGQRSLGFDGPTDPWPLLQDAAQVAPGTRIDVSIGSFPRRGAATLLRLSGFRVEDGPGNALSAVRIAASVEALSCSVIVPCRNEVGNVESLVRRVPEMGTHTEILFVDGGSTDGTPELIAQLVGRFPDRDIKILEQSSGGGKAAAVFQGFDAASGDVLMILDADMTVAPEDLPRFYLAVALGLADFANGTRFAYPMEKGAMRPANWLGNRAFAVGLSWITGSQLTDTLCGTKALRKSDWIRLSSLRERFGGHDLWGDFDLLLGAALLKLRVLDIPVPYGARTAGDSKMQPFRHTLPLLLTCIAGWRSVRTARRSARRP